MSTSDRVRAILHATIQAYRGAPAYRQRGDVFCQAGPHRCAPSRTAAHRVGWHTQGRKIHSRQRPCRRRHRSDRCHRGHPDCDLVPARSDTAGHRQPSRRSTRQRADHPSGRAEFRPAQDQPGRADRPGSRVASRGTHRRHHC
uniref:Mutant IniC n=1 Tax=Mycobacterium tuberculosis TaxID=1773 RepID=Q4TUX9_MYCTX|nr:mutant IniC [Mycobacterium tuberculosis]